MAPEGSRITITLPATNYSASPLSHYPHSTHTKPAPSSHTTHTTHYRKCVAIPGHLRHSRARYLLRCTGVKLSGQIRRIQNPQNSGFCGTCHSQFYMRGLMQAGIGAGAGRVTCQHGGRLKHRLQAHLTSVN